MRDIDRIDRILLELRKAWIEAPDLRFGQFMGNVFSQSNIDFFFQEDDLLLENIHKFRNQTLADNFQFVEEDRASGMVGCSAEELEKHLNEVLTEDTSVNSVWNAVKQMMDGLYYKLHTIYEPDEHGWYCAAVDLFRPSMTFRLYFEIGENNMIDIKHLERWFLG